MFETATLQNTILTRMRCPNLVSGLRRASNGSSATQNAYLSNYLTFKKVFLAISTGAHPHVSQPKGLMYEEQGHHAESVPVSTNGESS